MKIKTDFGGLLTKLSWAVWSALCLGLAGCGDLHRYDALFGPPPEDTRRIAAGTGILVNDQGDILTVAHMIDHCFQLRVAGQGIPAQQATLIGAGEEDIGLALLHIAQKDTPSVFIGPSWNGYNGTPKIEGAPLVITGFPESNLSLVPSRVESNGIGAANMKLIGHGFTQTVEPVLPEKRPYWPGWEIWARSGPGFSGGAIFDPAHRVIGIVVGGDSDMTIGHVSDDMLAYLAKHTVPTNSQQNKENNYDAIVRVNCYNK